MCCLQLDDRVNSTPDIYKGHYIYCQMPLQYFANVTQTGGLDTLHLERTLHLLSHRSVIFSNVTQNGVWIHYIYKGH